jgi:hypothetical protein
LPSFSSRAEKSFCPAFSLRFSVTEPEENALKDVLRVEVVLLGQGAGGATGRGVNRYLDEFHGVTEVIAYS